MDGITGLAAVILLLGIPVGVVALYTFYRVQKLRSEERLAAIHRGVNVPMEPELPPAAKSRRHGILFLAGSISYMIAFSIVARFEPDAMIAGAFGAIPFMLGLGFLLDSVLIRRDVTSAT
jgi:hypothetical protein